MLDPAQAALLVRVTARISAVLFATSLVAAARRVGVRNPRAVRSARRGDLAAFGLWVAAHSIHFAAGAPLPRGGGRPKNPAPRRVPRAPPPPAPIFAARRAALPR